MLMKNTLKQIGCICVAFTLLLSCVIQPAAFYTPGEKEYLIGDISLTVNEASSKEFYLPFDAGSIRFTYTADSVVNLNITTSQQEISVSLEAASSETEKTISLYETTDILNSFVERKGEHVWVFSADKDIKLSGVTLIKYSNPNIDIGGETTVYCQTALSENEKAISSAVLIDRNASVIMVNGARRYIDNGDVNEIPQVIEGSIYLPARTLALALGCYYESIPGKNYVMLRNNECSKEFYFTTDESYCQSSRGEKSPITFRPAYKNGELFLPVRYFAETTGKTVEYHQDGIVVIDEPYAVKNIMNSESVLSYIKSVFADFVPTDSVGKTYHVAQVANASDTDANAGTEAVPFKTLAKASEKAVAGDTVIIHKGVYRETLAPQNNGTGTKPIIFKAAEGEEVVISATKEISGFRVRADGLIEADIDRDLGDGRNQVFYNNACITEARYPDMTEENKIPMSETGEELSDLFPVKGDLKVDLTDKTLVTSETLLTEETIDYWKGATFVSLHGYGWSLGTAKVAGSEKGKLLLEDISTKWWYDRQSGDHFWNWGYLSGHINAISKPGEWVIQDGKLIMKPLDGTTADTFKAEVKQRQLVIDLTNRKYIQIKDIKTFGGSAKLNESEMCVLNNVDMKYISHYTHSDDQREGFIDDYTARKDRKNIGAPERGEVGVYISGRDNAVINSVLDHSAAAGLYLVGTHTYVDNNIISNCGYMGSYVGGITISSEPWKDPTTPRGGFAIYNNTVYNSGRSVLHCQGSEGITFPTGVKQLYPFMPFEIAYNDFHDGSLFALDTGIVYAGPGIFGTDKQSSRFHDNYVYTTTPETNTYSFGLYNDGNSMGIDFYNNVVFTTEENTKYSDKYIVGASAWSSCTNSGNSEIYEPVSGGAVNLSAEQFPLGKPFYAGSLQNAAVYTKNYEQLDESAEYYSVSEATCSSGVSVADGKASFGAINEQLCFENVDFGADGYNRINLYYTGDRYKKNDFFNVYVGSSMDNAQKYELVLSSNANGLSSVDFDFVDTEKTTGVQNVYIVPKTLTMGAKICGMMLSDDAKPAIQLSGDNVAATDYTRIHTMGNKNSRPENGSYHGIPFVRNTYSGTVLIYKNVVLNQAANYAGLAVATGASYTPQTVTLHVNSPDAAPIASLKKDSSDAGFYENDVYYTPLNSTLQAGAYDIYVKFTGGSTSNFFSFGFSPNNPVE